MTVASQHASIARTSNNVLIGDSSDLDDTIHHQERL